MIDINWVMVSCNALTAIRHDWPVEKLARMAAEGHDTPVSGDVLQEYRQELR